MIDLKTLKQLIKLMTDHDLSEMDLQDGDEKVKLKRSGLDENVQLVAPAPVAAPAVAPNPAPAPPSGGAEARGGDSAPADDGLETITSPMVGTFYTASSPDSPPFVKVGDDVGPDTVICVIEAMKVFSEIKAEIKGQIVDVLVENGQGVDFGQPLFKVRA